jgi:N-acetylneuraminic acid mutarotase
MKALIILFTSMSLQAQVWVQLPDFPATKRDDGAAVVVNNVAYVGTGLQEWNATIDFFALDLHKLSWKKMNDMPHGTERQYACSFPGIDCFYVTCGDGVGGALNNTYKYDIATNSWTLMAPKPGAGLIAASCFSFGDKVIIVGGKFQNAKLNKEVWEYTISTNSWLQKNDFPFSPTWRGSHCTLNNLGYLMFGVDSNNVFSKTLYKYNPTIDSWQSIIDFPLAQGRAYAAMEGLNNRLCVFGGMDTTGTFYNDTWFFREGDLTWIPGPSLPGAARRGGMSYSSGKDFYYSCGYSALGRLTETWRTDVPTAITEIESENKSVVYFDSVDEMLHIKLSATQSSPNFTCTLFNLDGKLLFTKDFDIAHCEINVANLSKGIYLLKIERDNVQIEVKKIFKK